MPDLIALAIVGILIGEITARVWRAKQQNPFMRAPIYRSSDIIPWELLPNSRWRWNVKLAADLEPTFHREIEVNSLGYREREFMWKKPPKTYRVLFLGDSYVLGWGVQMKDTITRQLEPLLQTGLPHKRVEVINAAFACGYSPDTYYLYLKHRGLSLEPDLVISSFVPRNDLKELRFNNRILGPDGLPERVISKIDFVDDVTHCRRRVFPSRVPVQLRRASALFDWGIKKARCYIIGPGDQDALAFLKNPSAGGYRESWQPALQSFEASNRLLQSQSHPIPYLVVLVPEPHEIHPEFWQTLGLPFDRELFYDIRPQREALRMAEMGKFPCLDLLPGLRKCGQHERLYFRHYAHWNPVGHRRAAEGIAAYLRERLSLSGRSRDWPRQADTVQNS